MCGFAGMSTRGPRACEELRATVDRMNRCIRYRGPSSSGTWIDREGRGALACSRLAIQDLSRDADLPMLSASARYVIAYNGEIYNVDELRQRLGRSPDSFHTHSDTEVLLACVEEWGVEGALRELNGMFAFAVWDCATDSVFLARDRMGEKPLHYALGGDTAFFASEIKSILAAEPTRRPLSREALQAYFALTYIPAPYTVFEGIRKVRPGCFVEIDRELRVVEKSYWTLRQVVQSCGVRSEAEYPALVSHTEELLVDSVKRRLVSDVPVGVLLSGGVDSSLVAYTVSGRLGVPLQTFTIGLEDAGQNEREHASAIAAELHVKNTALTLTRSDAISLADTIFDFLDEPFGDYSAIPTYAVSKLAAGEVTVLLSGDGGDELFGGYNRYRWTTGWHSLAARAYASYRLRRLALRNAAVALEVYRRLMTLGDEGGALAPEVLDRYVGGLSALKGASVLQHLRYIDFMIYLPDDILVKTDRMSMANSMELRSPFLDHRLVEFSWTLPDDAIVQGSVRKRITRDLFLKYPGSRYLQAKKYGFGLPVWQWLVGPLRPDMEVALDAVVDRPDLPLNGKAVRHNWQRLLAGENGLAHDLWGIYAFWKWSNRWEKRTS